MNNKVSIIIPIYNGEKTIEKCLNSIINQIYKNFEVLMINDGSVDNTETICKKFAQNDARFRYIFKKNGGVSSARNLGLCNITGNFISFVDCDDTLSEKFLSTLINNMLKFKCNISVCNFNLISNNVKQRESTDSGFVFLNYNDFLINLVNGKGMTSGCLNKIYKRELLKNIIFNNVSVAEDLNYNYDIVKQNKEKIKVVYTKVTLYNYYLSSINSVMHNNFTKKNLDILLQYNKLIEESKEFDEFNNSLKASFVFISMKLIIKMVASSFYDCLIYNDCLNVIHKYKKNVFKSIDYSVFKKIFLFIFLILKRCIINSYNKHSIFKKLCIYINKKVG